ncbi:GNAT family N-acetyltransferase, partial [Patulibacter sp. S7RM1-6]
VDVRSRGDARRLAATFRAAGYVVAEHHVLAADPTELRARTTPRPGRSYVVAPEGPEAAEPVRRAAEEGQERTPEEREQVARQWSLVPAADVLHLVARDAAGDAVGSLVVHLASLHLEVDDVLTHPARERAGVGTALLAAVAELGLRRDVGRVTLLADPNDYAASWYARRGFATVGRTTAAHRPPAA